MYKVHFENRSILISPEPDRLQKYGLFHKFRDTKEIYKLIADFQADLKISAINIYGPDIRHIWKIFRIYFTEVGAAGGLVKHTSGRFLFIEKTSWVLMEYKGKMITEPQVREGITRVEWLLPDEISRIKETAWLSLMDLIN